MAVLQVYFLIRMRRGLPASERLSLCAALFATSLFGQSTGTCPVNINPKTAVRNSAVELTVTTPPNVKQGDIVIERNGAKIKQAAKLENGTLTFALPDNIPLGHHNVTAELDNKAYPACDQLNVIPAPNWKVSLAPFEPNATYDTETVWVRKSPGSKIGKPVQTARLKLRGSGFVIDPSTDNQIVVNGDLMPVTWDGCDVGHDAGNRNNALDKVVVHGKVVSPEMIDLCGVPVPPSREFKVAVKQGDMRSEIQSFRVYRFATFWVAAASALIAICLGLMVLWLVRLLSRQQLRDQPTKNVRLNALQILFLDPETNSYSLSKLQFYFWTAAALFGYSYLVIGRMMVQGQIWPDIPGTLPGILAIGAGTAVGSQFVTSVRGPKGAGSESPSLGDFVTSGGVAAPDRVQMLVWTIVGVGAFCVAVLRYAPGTIETLDAVPTGMLYLMGLSSVGYLGGKLARKPGPVINEISVTPGESDEALALAAAPPPPGPPDLSQPVAQAQALLQTFANVPPGSAQTAVDALSKAIQSASRVKTLTDAQEAVTDLAHFRSQAEAAARAAADAFAQVEAAPESARAAEIAEQAAAALQDLSASVSSVVATTMAPASSVSAATQSFTRHIELRGRNLSSEALVEINGSELPFRMLREDENGRHLPELVVREPDDPSLARVLRLSIDPSQLEMSDYAQYKKWFGKTDPDNPRILTLINLDGQKSDIRFTVPPSAAQSSTKTQKELPDVGSPLKQGA
jgi:hypothetical protein